MDDLPQHLHEFHHAESPVLPTINDAEIHAELLKVLTSEFCVDPNVEITEDTLLLDLGLDSMDMTMFVMYVEQQFNVHFSHNVASNINTLAELVSAVHKYQQHHVV